MLHETLKALRKQKGYSQEEVASRLNVVRQTVSKWEKGLSVPDADMLVKIAELFEVSVSCLLGSSSEETSTESAAPELSEIAEQLSRINEQLVIRNRRSRRIWRTIVIVLISFYVVTQLMILLSVVLYSAYRVEGGMTTIEEYSYIIDEQTENTGMPSEE